MINMYEAIRTCLGMKSLSNDISILDISNTKAVANPIARAFFAELETASEGHIPNTCTNTGFSRQTPLINSSVEG